MRGWALQAALLIVVVPALAVRWGAGAAQAQSALQPPNGQAASAAPESPSPVPPPRPAGVAPVKPRSGTASLVPPESIDRPDRTRSPAPPTTGALKTVSPDTITPLPGRFAPEPTRLPSAFLKDKTVAPRTPDVQVDLSDRTTLGAFGDLSQNPLKAENRITPTPARPLQGLDLGAGVTLQYKFPTN